MIVRSKQPIKIKKPFQSLLTFSHSAGEKNILQTVLLSFFFSFYFLNALQSDNNSNRVYVLGHKYVLGPSQTHFSPRLAARAKMSLSRAQNIFMPANINSIVIFSSYKTACFR